MFQLFLGCLLFVTASSLQVFVALEGGEPKHPFVVDEHVVHESGLSKLYLTTSHRCVSSIRVVGSFAPGSVTVEKILGVRNELHQWVLVGEEPLVSGTATISVEPIVCTSSWRLTAPSSEKISPWKDISMVGNAVLLNSTKRVVSCEDLGIYPPECSSASEGALCLDNGLCGCKQDKDCFSNADFPFCFIQSGNTEGICERCTTVGTGNADHFFCRSRYPGYTDHPTDGYPLSGERAAPLNYFREVCVRTPVDASGSCQRCNQAPLQPQYKFPSNPSNQGASGTFHCNSIRPTSPICMDQTYFNDCGVPLSYTANLRGSCVPCSLSAQCARALPATPSCNVTTGSCVTCKANTDCVGTGGNNCQADGTCLSCTSNANCGTLDGGEVTGSPVCNATTGICQACSTNEQCQGTSGKNCQADGSCQTCSSNSDCGAKDGGQPSDQPLCDVVAGICVSPCATNLDCALQEGKNCQKDGFCLSCKDASDCGPKDGGSTPDQPECDVPTGICATPFFCQNNTMCEGKPGANCQADGTCLSCTGTATCGVLDLGGQPNCNLVTRICVESCVNNSDCVDTQGSNCQVDGLCLSCHSNADCGPKDGGDPAGEVACNVTTGICGPCSSNADCPVETGNCGQDGFCYNCGAPGKSCADDGPPGKTPQPHCDATSGTCVTGCTLDEHCTDECSPRCNVETFCCVECLENGDCPHSFWRGSALAKGTCASDTHTCIAGCSVDGDCDTPNSACSHGICVECVNDAFCPDDRPACTPGGVCVECLLDSHCSDLGLPACSSSEQKCVGCTRDAHCPKGTKCEMGSQVCHQCVFDFHCDSNHYCSNDLVCRKGSRGDLSVGALVGVAIAVAALALVSIAVIVLAWKLRSLTSEEAQRLI